MKRAFLGLFAVITAVKAYHWPSPLIDQLEGLLYEGKSEGSDSRAIDFAAQLVKCVPQPDGESIAADWIRFAYHDVATHNIEDGTGGLDNSLLLELDRDENVGLGMRRSEFDFIDFPNKYISFSDVTAIGLILASVECGGPVVRFRGGRLDASVAGPPGVPTPEQTLEEHTESLQVVSRSPRLQGFNAEDMIALVACGHSVGGVRNPDFPTLVPASDDGSQVFKFFDTTTQLDNTVVLQYLNGTTTNPLVIDANTTMTSDLRIFSSDGNVTMNRLADPETFAQTCSRPGRHITMINTVPSTVTLTEVIEPISVKVNSVQLTIGKDTLLLKASLRVCNVLFLTANEKRVVTIFWADQAGGCVSQACSAPSTGFKDVTTTLTARLGLSPTKYSFSAPVNVTTSISKFWFQVDEGDSTAIVTVDNDGTGYEITQDRVLYVPSRSTAFTTVVAIRNDILPSRVFIDVYTRGPILSKTLNLVPFPQIPSRLGYDFYSVNNTGSDMTFDLHSVVNGVIYTEDMRDTYF
ncbi:heme peroxidase, partial [Mycena floridula]